MNIHVLCGGESSEHEISLRSARAIINNLDKEKYNVSFTYITKDGKFVPIGKYIEDIENPEDLKRITSLNKKESIMQFIDFINQIEDPYILPVIHGTTGEDGQIQGFLETLGIKYIGNKIAPSAICFDKAIANDLFALHGIPQAKYYVINKKRYMRDANKESIVSNILDKLGENVFVKPASNGSSIGVSRANKDNIIQALEEAFKYDDKVVVEEEMPFEELEVSVLGNENPIASLPGSYTTQREIFDYEAKYHDKNLVMNVPHELSESDSNRVRELAIDAYLAVGCNGFARVDIFMGLDGNFYVNEINTFPGMTPTSLSPGLWKATDGINYGQVLDRIISYAIERYENA